MSTANRIWSGWLAICLFAVLEASGRSDEVEIKLSDCPATVRKTLLAETQGGKIETVYKETEKGKSVFYADAVIDDKPYGLTVQADGTLIEKYLDEGDEIELSEAPAAVQKTLRMQAKGTKIETIYKIVKDGKTTYETDLVIKGEEITVRIDEDGTRLKDEVGDPVDVKLADCPAAVQKTFQAEVRGAKLVSVTKTKENGAFVYGAGAVLGGKHYHLTAAEDGTLTLKALDEDEVKKK